MLVAAALCPAPPLLARELTGGSPVVPELRQACRDAVAAALSPRPDLVAVIGTAAETGAWDAATEADLAAFAPALHAANAGPAAADGGGGTLPVALGLGGRLLDQAGYRGRRVLHAVSEDLPPADCAALGARLAELDARVTLVVMADGSARRTLKAPGYLDERSGPFDAAAERALRSGDLASLLDLDAALARELMATGRPGWHVLAGAARGVRAVCEVGYRGDPFGVFYLAATLAFTPPG